MAKSKGEKAPPDPRRKVEAALLKLAAKTFAKSSEVNSIAMYVAQYYCDEADDAVHVSLRGSPRSFPLADDRCDVKISSYSELPWDDNDPDLIAAFEPYCREGSEDYADYLPYAVVRRDGGFERTGRSQRPWLDQSAPIALRSLAPRESELLASVYASPGDDGPRAVLADWWLERDDPRSEFVRLQLRGASSAEERAREEELLQTHGRALLGALGPAVHREGAVFRRGFLSEVEISFSSEKQARAIVSDPVWGTVERLHFLGEKHHVLHPSMSALRSVSGLSKGALQELAGGTAVYGIEDLAVGFPLGEVAQILHSKSCLPKLVRLEGTPGRTKTLAALVKKLPESVRVIGLPHEDLEDLAPLFASIPRDRIFEIVSRDDLGRGAGWRFQIIYTGERTQLRCERDNPFGLVSLAQVRQVRQMLPGEVDITLVPSRYFEPLPEDLDILTSDALDSAPGIDLNENFEDGYE